MFEGKTKEVWLKEKKGGVLKEKKGCVIKEKKEV